MSEQGEFDPQRALAVVMGNSRWDAGAYEDNAACRHSAEAMHEYLLDPKGLGIEERNVLAVIDDQSAYPGQILDRVHGFLSERKDALQGAQRPVRDLLFYYVGHGSFSESKDYFLPICKTRGPDFEGTSIRVEALAKIIKAAGRSLRCHMIFDACFSAATFQAFLSSGPADVAVQKTLHAFPSSGIALLCSAGRSDPALAPEGLRDTVFTGELLRILREGDRAAPDRLSFGDLAVLISERLAKRFTDVIRPHVSSPRQNDGQVHVVPLFPNLLAGATPPPAEATGPDRPGQEAGPPRSDGQATKAEGPVKTQEPVRIRVGQYTLTDSQWSKVPKEVQSLLLSWQEETYIGYGCDGARRRMSGDGQRGVVARPRGGGRVRLRTDCGDGPRNVRGRRRSVVLRIRPPVRVPALAAEAPHARSQVLAAPGMGRVRDHGRVAREGRRLSVGKLLHRSPCAHHDLGLDVRGARHLGREELAAIVGAASTAAWWKSCPCTDAPLPRDQGSGAFVGALSSSSRWEYKHDPPSSSVAIVLRRPRGEHNCERTGAAPGSLGDVQSLNDH